MRNEYCRKHACKNIEKLVREGCVTKDTGEELLRDQIFRLEHEEVDFSTFSESALRPLRREQDPEIQQKVISIVENAGKEKVMNYGTERKMKAAIDRFHDVELEKPKPKEETYTSCACSSCGGTDEDAVMVALNILRQYDAPPELCDSIQKWIVEKYK